MIFVLSFIYFILLFIVPVVLTIFYMIEKALPQSVLIHMLGNYAMYGILIGMIVSKLRIIHIRLFLKILGIVVFLHAFFHIFLYFFLTKNANFHIFLYEILTRPYLVIGSMGFVLIVILTIFSFTPIFGYFKRLSYPALILIESHNIVSQKAININDIFIFFLMMFVVSINLITKK